MHITLYIFLIFQKSLCRARLGDFGIPSHFTLYNKAVKEDIFHTI